jgi:CheY-like chemotaxis protein
VRFPLRSGYAGIEAVADAESVVKAALAHPDLVLMDISCPCSTAMMRRGRSRRCHGSAAIAIICRDFAMNGIGRTRGPRVANHYVTEPYSRVPLLRVIRGFLNQTA